MTRLGMVIDLERCLGCQTCSVVCKAENATPPGVFWGRVLKKEEGVYPDAKRSILPVLCMHCQDPACVKVCPSGASQQRADGLVFIDYQMCIGCRYCMMACPYQARLYLSETETYFPEPTPYEQVTKAVLGKGIPKGVVSKCNFCKDRVDQGMQPACVAGCLGNARIFGDLDDPHSEVAVLIKERKHFQLQVEAGTNPSVFYLAQIKPTLTKKTFGRRSF